MHGDRIGVKSLSRPWCRDIPCNSWCVLQKAHRHAATAPRKRHLETLSCMHSICLGFPLRCPRKEGQGMPSMASGFENEGFSLLSLCNAGVTDSSSRSDFLVALRLLRFCFFSFFCFGHCCVCFLLHIPLGTVVMLGFSTTSFQINALAAWRLSLGF